MKDNIANFIFYARMARRRHLPRSPPPSLESYVRNKDRRKPSAALFSIAANHGSVSQAMDLMNVTELRTVCVASCRPTCAGNVLMTGLNARRVTLYGLRYCALGGRSHGHPDCAGPQNVRRTLRTVYRLSLVRDRRGVVKSARVTAILRGSAGASTPMSLVTRRTALKVTPPIILSANLSPQRRQCSTPRRPGEGQR